MSCCCNTSTSKSARKHCLECGEPCLSVTIRTMVHQVQFPENQIIPTGDYVFCPNRQCPVGYFSPSNIILKEHLKAFKGGRKAMLCHCFDVSRTAYQSALESGTAESIKAFVVGQTKAGSCACEARNPSGRCCLADFSHMEKNERQA